MIEPAVIAMSGKPQVPGPSPITQWHRGFALLAVVSLFIGCRALWTDALPAAPAMAVVISGCYAAIFALAVLISTVSSRQLMTLVEAAVLGVAVVLAGFLFILHHHVADEGAFAARAADAILRGTPAYGVHWPDIFAEANVAVTKTMDGGFVDTMPYPPLMAILTAAVKLVIPGYVAATIVTMGTFIVGAIVLWLLLPAQWRSAGTAIMLGFGLLANYAHRGYPAIIASALLIPVAIGWAYDRPRRPTRPRRHHPCDLSRRGMRRPAAGVVRGPVPARRSLVGTPRRTAGASEREGRRPVRGRGRRDIPGDRPALHGNGPAGLA